MKKVTKIFCISLFVILLIMLFNLNGVIAAERPLRTAWIRPGQVDPAIGRDVVAQVSFLNIYDPLFLSDNDGNPLLHVAENWELSDDALTYTFYIRQGIKFHDGSELTASDVKFSMERMRTIGQGNAYLFLGQEINVEVVDKYIVKFHLEKVEGPFLKKLIYFYVVNEDLIRANIKKPGSYGEMGDYGTEFLTMHDAGSGPYMVQEIVMGSHMYTLVNPNYWLPIDPNAPDEWSMIASTEAATIRTLLSNRELEIGDDGQTDEALEFLDKIEGIDVALYDMGEFWFIALHTKKPPTDCIHFRKAMSWAVDYDTLLKYVFPGSTQERGPVSARVPGVDPTVFQYHRDLDKAMEELKQSKYYGQLDEYPVELYWVTQTAVEERIALLFMSNMADIGIKVKVTGVPWLAYAKASSTIESSPQAMIMYNNVRWAEAMTMIDMRYLSTTAPLTSQMEWLLDDELDAKIYDSLATIDESERYAKYSEIQHYITDLACTIFLTTKVTKHAYQSTYVDWYAAYEKFSPIVGYDLQVRKIKVYPEKIQKR